MKKCPKCGKTYDDTWKVCLHCSVDLSENLSVVETNPELRIKYTSSDYDGKSRFVTNVAWIFIIITGFTTLISILQNIVVNMVSPNNIKGTLNQPEAVKLFIFVVFAFSLTTLISSIGLLNRKNWARLVFITILILGIIWNLSSRFLPGVMMLKMSAEVAKQEGAQVFQIFTAIIAIGMSVLFGWIAKKLVSKKIKQEFIQSKGTV